MAPRVAVPRSAKSPESTQSPEVAELAAQLRLAVARLSRRIRQQAASTGEELSRVDPGRAGHDRAARPDHPRRAGGGRAGAAAEHDADRGPARGVGLRRPGWSTPTTDGSRAPPSHPPAASCSRAAARARTRSSLNASPISPDPSARSSQRRASVARNDCRTTRHDDGRRAPSGRSTSATTGCSSPAS